MIPENFRVNVDILVIPEIKGLKMIRISQIVSFESCKSGTFICSMIKNDSTVCKISLAAFAAFFAPRGFFRIHDNCVVNTCYVERVDKSPGQQAIMCNGKVYDISRTNMQDFEKVLLDLYRRLQGATTGCGTKPTGYGTRFTVRGFWPNKLWIALYIWQVFYETAPIETFLF